MNPRNVYKWQVSDNEKGIVTDIPHISTSMSSYKLYIPTIMPLIPKGKQTQVTTSLNKACYINDTSCKPSIATRIGTQNYITVKVFPNRSFRKNVFLNGSDLMVEIFNSDVHNMMISNKIDNSTDL
jgi:hypothetical protein